MLIKIAVLKTHTGRSMWPDRSSTRWTKFASWQPGKFNPLIYGRYENFCTPFKTFFIQYRIQFNSHIKIVNWINEQEQLLLFSSLSTEIFRTSSYHLTSLTSEGNYLRIRQLNRTGEKIVPNKWKYKVSLQTARVCLVIFFGTSKYICISIVWFFYRWVAIIHHFELILSSNISEKHSLPKFIMRDLVSRRSKPKYLLTLIYII